MNNLKIIITNMNRKVNKRSIVKNQVKPVDQKKEKNIKSKEYYWKNRSEKFNVSDEKRKERNEKSKKYYNDNKEMIRIKKEEKAKYEKSLEKNLMI